MNRSPSVADALGDVRGRIAAAARRAGRQPGDVTLVAVTKTISAGRIGEAVAAGQRVFGENRVQEAKGKIEALGPGISWHLIGHLQKNKAKTAVEVFDVVEAVDSGDLALLLDRRAGERGKRLPVLLQVMVSPEETKSGLDPAGLPALIEKVLSLPNLDLRGLMAIPPWPERPEDSRPHVARLRDIRDRWDGKCCPAGTLRELSMGMTADFEIAVEEGATLVRVGSAIFGARPYP